MKQKIYRNQKENRQQRTGKSNRIATKVPLPTDSLDACFVHVPLRITVLPDCSVSNRITMHFWRVDKTHLETAIVPDSSTRTHFKSLLARSTNYLSTYHQLVFDDYQIVVYRFTYNNWIHPLIKFTIGSYALQYYFWCHYYLRFLVEYFITLKSILNKM